MSSSFPVAQTVEHWCLQCQVTGFDSQGKQKACLSFFRGKEIKFFEENISGLFSTQWTSTVT